MRTLGNATPQLIQLAARPGRWLLILLLLALALSAGSSEAVPGSNAAGANRHAGAPLAANLAAVNNNLTQLTIDPAMNPAGTHDIGAHELYCQAITIQLSTTNPLCVDVLNGQIFILARGGTGTLSYSNDGGMTFQASSIFNNLGVGAYNLVVRDANGCQATDTVTLRNPTPINFTTTNVNPLCNGASNGKITLTVTSGTGPLLYSINNGASFQASNVFSNLTAGTYNLLVDANFCQATATVTLNNPPAVSFTTANVNPVCDGASNGQITFNATGGTGALMYSINNGGSFQASNVFSNLAAGTYNLAVRDANGCMAAATTATLTNPPAASANKLTVNDLGDTADATPGDGLCNDGTGKCTLRAAIQEADALAACLPFTINFSVTGVINLATALPDLAVSLTITGPGANLLTVSGNSAVRVFVINSGKIITLTGLTIANGLATDASPNAALGGGIYNNGTLNITGSTLSGNTVSGSVEGYGGGIYNFGTLNVTSSTLSGNTASGRVIGFGGGIYNNGTLNVTGSTLSGNTATSSADSADGGGIYNLGISNVTNCTLSGNAASGSKRGRGGSILSIGGTVNVKNTINAGNSVAGSIFTEGPDVHGIFTSQGYNLIGRLDDNAIGFTATGDQTGTIAAPLNALLAPLGNYGGPTNTHALLPGSPAINAGTNTGAPAADQRGIARPQQTTTDIGAFESRGFTLAIVSGNNQTTPPMAALANPLLVSLTSGFGEPVQGGLVTFTSPGSGASATLSGNPATINASSRASVTATANNQQGAYQVAAAANGANTVNFNLTNSCSVIALGGLPNGQAGVAYNQTIIATPTGGGYSFAQTDGALPPGFALAANGQLSGTPTTAGTYSFTVTATGFSGLCSVSQSYTLAIVCPAISLSPSSLPNATVNTAYPQTITANPAGGSYAFALTSGLLPVGVTLNSNGSFGGAPTQSGVFNFRITASGFGGCTGFNDYTLVVTCPAITVNPANLPGGSVGTAYSQTVSTSPAGTYNYSVASGTLPTGLTLNASTGAITGTPTANGSFNFTVTASSGGMGGCIGSRSYTVSVGCSTITLSPAPPLPSGQAGVAFSQAITASPSGSYTFSMVAGNLPGGLTLNPTTGVISGLPSVTGNYNFTVKAQMAGGCNATQAYSLAIVCPAVTLSPGSLPGGTIGAAYSQTVSATPAGGNYSYAVTTGGLPTGLNLNSATGLLNGTPIAAGSFTFRITATGFGACGGFRDYAVAIGGGGCPAITLPDLPNGLPGQLYSNSVAASPSGAYSYAMTTGDLPPGVSFYGAAALLFGYPSAGTYNFTITATDSNNCTASKSYTVVIGTASARAAVANDFSGDRKSDFVLWRAAQAQWLIVDSATGKAQTIQWGQAGGLAVPGDYDGDGKTDLAVFGKDGHWLIKLSGNDTTVDKLWGLGTDVPVPGDYDGDGKTDLAVWRGTETTWHILRSSDGQTQTVEWGSSAAPYFDVPVPGDYDGDGKTDIAVFRQGGQQSGHWYIRRSSDGQIVDKHWGFGTDVPMPGDYDGDGKTDIAVWRGAESNWYIIHSTDGVVETKFWGASYAPYFDVPSVGDYDGDGKADAAVWRKADGRWYILQSSDGAGRALAQGKSGDQPVTATPRS